MFLFLFSWPPSSYGKQLLSPLLSSPLLPFFMTIRRLTSPKTTQSQQIYQQGTRSEIPHNYFHDCDLFTSAPKESITLRSFRHQPLNDFPEHCNLDGFPWSDPVCITHKNVLPRSLSSHRTTVLLSAKPSFGTMAWRRNQLPNRPTPKPPEGTKHCITIFSFMVSKPS